jgi:hypothetical protein
VEEEEEEEEGEEGKNILQNMYGLLRECHVTGFLIQVSPDRAGVGTRER